MPNNRENQASPRAAGADRPLVVALAGNPNAGKTTLFNALTGARQHVGNYPGVTVEKKEGACRHAGRRLRVVDLPGTYGLTAYSVEELVARDFLLDERPDVVVDIVDASNLERNLYLAVQLMELGVPLVLAFNMSDVAEARGIRFDLELLSRLLGAPIVPTVAHKGRGTDELLEAVLAVAGGDEGVPHPHPVRYGPEIEPELAALTELVAASDAADTDRHPPRWLALKLLEADRDIRKRVGDEQVLAAARRSAKHLQSVCGDRPEILIADRRYGFISGACQEAVESTVEYRHTLSDRIDEVVTHRLIGIPIFLALMYAVFYLTFTLGDAPTGWIEELFHWAGGHIARLWPKASDSLLRSLIVDGIIGGVGGVVAFLPNILLLFLAIAALEDSGYMARAAFLMDRVMHKIGLHGKSFIPMLIGFGCSVPAILATRTLGSRRDRLTTMLVVPLMSCGARLPIYALLIPAFFPQAWQAPVLWAIYLIGIALAVGAAKLLRKTILRGESEAFVMELPPYRLPTFRGLLIHTWQRGWMYLRKAGTVILLISIVLWAMTAFPRSPSFAADVPEEAGRIDERVVAGARRVAAEAGLDANAVAAAVRAERDLAAAARTHWAHEAGYVEARRRRRETIDRLTEAPEGEGVGAFLGARDRVLAARGRFEEAVRDVAAEAGDIRYLALAKARDDALDDARRSAPDVFPAVLRYLDDVRDPALARLRRLRAEHRARRLAHSTAGRVGHTLETVLAPLGFDWRIGTALIGALAAKEVFVAQMGIVFSVGEGPRASAALRERLRVAYRPLVAFCIMLFCLIGTPCVATVAVTWRESGSWRWPLLQWAGLTVLAYVVTLIVYQVGSLL